MKLQELLNNIVAIDSDLEISGLAIDSRQVEPGFLFLAVNGNEFHGLEYIEQAIEKGAQVVLYDPAGSGENLAKNIQNVSCYSVADLSGKLAEIAARFYREPSKQLTVIGVTGTNGKTSCSQFLAQLLDDAGVIGTLGWGEPGDLKQTLNTTPDAVVLQQILAEFVRQGKKYAVMEVSSHGLVQGRVQGIEFDAAVLTNLSRDHLDYHGSMQQYLQAKLKLFECQSLQFAVVNLDDESAEPVLKKLTGRNIKVLGFSLKKNTAGGISDRVWVDAIEHDLKGIRFVVEWHGQRTEIETQLTGFFNVENILLVITVLLGLGWPIETIAEKIKSLKPVAGRMQRFGGEGRPVVLVDYAHTPDALEKLLQGVKPYVRGRLKVVFGCGGDRDSGKRALMGKVAKNWADEIVLTDDNPRNEDSRAIIEDILTGCQTSQTRVVQNRAEAIEQTITQAEIDDCIVIAGKGHENYQEIKGIRRAFSDQQCVKQALQEYGK